MEKRIILAVGAVALVLALWHLCVLAGYQFSVGLFFFSAFLVAFYLLPLLILWTTPMPTESRAKRYFIATLHLFVFGITLLLPLRRFLPGYRPEALESLSYIAVPVVETALILVFLFVNALWPKRAR